MKRLFLLYLLIAPGALTGFSQEDEMSVKQVIVTKDSLFWRAYNNCDVDGMNEFFTRDVEFYHDKGGFMTSLSELTASVKKNLCGNADFRVRREEVRGSVEVHLLKKNDSIYGAIMSGQHVFYIREKGKKEFLDGLARFTHLWLLENAEWKMKRVLSYDHGPADRLEKTNGR